MDRNSRIGGRAIEFDAIIGHDHPRACRRTAQCDRPPDPAPSPGDNDIPVRQFARHPASPAFRSDDGLPVAGGKGKLAPNSKIKESALTNSGPMEDRLLIRELFGLYGDASCKGDADSWLATFAEDCEWNSHMFNRKGKADLREQWDQLWLAFDNLGFLSEIGWIAVDGDTARASSQAREIIRLKDGGLFKLIGHYDDYLVRENGQWLFSRRNYQPLVLEEPGV